MIIIPQLYSCVLHYAHYKDFHAEALIDLIDFDAPTRRDTELLPFWASNEFYNIPCFLYEAFSVDFEN